METLVIQAFTFEQRHELLGGLTEAVTDCGGWVLERKTLSHDKMEFCIEIQLRAALDLYASVIAIGMEFTRCGHDALTELCIRRKHQRLTNEADSAVELHLELTFLDDITVHSLLTASTGLA